MKKKTLFQGFNEMRESDLAKNAAPIQLKWQKLGKKLGKKLTEDRL